jgi:hypothetical protein
MLAINDRAKDNFSIDNQIKSISLNNFLNVIYFYKYFYKSLQIKFLFKFLPCCIGFDKNLKIKYLSSMFENLFNDSIYDCMIHEIFDIIRPKHTTSWDEVKSIFFHFLNCFKIY